MRLATRPLGRRRRPTPVPQWKPPVDAATLARFLITLSPERVLSRVLDAVGDVLDSQESPEYTLPALDVLLRAGLEHLARLASRCWIEEPLAGLIARAGELQSSDLPADIESAQTYIRQMALTAEGLLEHLIEAEVIGEIEPPPAVPQEHSQNWYLHA
ncbi:hypothetical protein OG897_32035 [Streptomyces sp. NBC_00237]|uniref:hypothetical protein n=1 Tax=Streptomyces sp. NBC_00237 TaxID=2975687 RepID=UPI00225C3F61|nr:hypothetical protein [Streptomyces sp. NBC_00237]MCX5206033.1 hypothetical protein [Streptomyces sp. NBC_00237]